MEAELLYFLKNSTPVTFALMLIIFSVSIVSFYNRSFFMKMILHPYSIFKQREYYRLVTSDLVHVDFIHLMLNEAMLYFFGGNLEEELKRHSSYGSWQFLIIYFSSWLCGVVYTTIKHRNEFDFSSAGASGSILGCAISFMIMQPNTIAFYVPLIGGVKNKYDALIFILALIWYQRKSKNQMLNHELHLFGALGGIVATLILFHNLL